MGTRGREGLGVLNRSQNPPPPVVPEGSRQAPIPGILIGNFPFYKEFYGSSEISLFFSSMSFMYGPEISRKCVRNREIFKVSMGNFLDIPPRGSGFGC